MTNELEHMGQALFTAVGLPRTLAEDPEIASYLGALTQRLLASGADSLDVITPDMTPLERRLVQRAARLLSHASQRLNHPTHGATP